LANSSTFSGRDRLLVRTFWAAVVVALALDLYLIAGRGVYSISGHVWDACDACPWVTAAGCAATAAACYLLRRDWRAAAAAAFLGGHLFTHW
jgi:hypothetical protein